MKLLSILIFILFFVSCGEQSDINFSNTGINEGLSEERRNEISRDIFELTEGVYSAIGFNY